VRALSPSSTSRAGLGGSGNIWVVYLKNADAVKLATVLRAPSGRRRVGGWRRIGGSTSTPARPRRRKPRTKLGQHRWGGRQHRRFSAIHHAPFTPSAGPSTGGFIQADPGTNSLIITAPEPMYRQLRAVIDQLDGRRAQVYVEA
jgi:general secretion pathway protein D